MGAYDKIEELRTRRMQFQNSVRDAEAEYRAAVLSVKNLESELKRAKSWRNNRDRLRKDIKSGLKVIENKIKTHAYQVRQYIKKHPFKAFEDK